MIYTKIFLEQEYLQKQKPLKQIGKENKTSAKTVHKYMKKFGIPRRSFQESQQLALKNGRATHPTKGKKRNIKTKV